MMGRRRAILIVSTVPVLLLMVAALGRAAVQNHPVTLMEKDAVVLQKLDDDAGDHAFETHVTDQMRQLIKRAKKEKANADSEDSKGLALAEKAKRTCQIAKHLHDTDDGLEKRARMQREASQSLEGHAAVLTDESDTQMEAYTGLQKKGIALKDKGQALQENAETLIKDANATNSTLHPAQHSDLLKTARAKKEAAAKLLGAAKTILDKAEAHKRNADSLKASASRTAAAGSAVTELGERFEREAINHRLKTMTFRSKCTMLRARAQAALRKAQDEAKNAAVLDKIVKPEAKPQAK